MGKGYKGEGKNVSTSVKLGIISLKKLCQEYPRDMLRQIKLIYDVSETKVQADYCHDIIVSNDKKKTSYDVLEEWYQLEKSN